MKDEKTKKSHEEPALTYHREGRPGKVEVIPTKPCSTSRDLSLAYSPGVALPCIEIAKDPEEAFKYTAKGNLVGVVSNGSAVLGLGNIGALAGKPVMEGKGVLFKKFADIDVFDIEIDEATVEGMVRTVTALGPTFGGINLEDIKAPECFEVEKQLKEILDIPVFHDDQHGTAIIAAAAFINALEIAEKKIEDVSVVFSGAGAASIAIANLLMDLGLKPENLFMCDSKGVIYKGRTEGMNPYKEKYVNDTKARTLGDAMKNADAFMGCSAKGVLTKEMVKTMANNPIIFAMANPDPEILPEEVAEVRDDAIMATGRSDYPNQVNNVLGFPFIFRGALDVRARKINEEMKHAAVYALANLAKESVPEEVRKAYGDSSFVFGRNYLIPKPFDKRVLTRVSPAVAKAACESGVARYPITDFEGYAESLDRRLGADTGFTKSLRSRINKNNKPQIVFSEGMNQRILQAVSILLEEGRVKPILLGDKEKIHQKMEQLDLEHLKEIEIRTPELDEHFEDYASELFKMRQRKGVSYTLSQELMEDHDYFAAMMVRKGLADGMITGTTKNYPECIKPIMKVIGLQKNHKGTGVIILKRKNKVLFLSDCTMKIKPTSEQLCQTALDTVKLYRDLMLKEPKVAFLSFSNFGSNYSESPRTVAKAVALTKEKDPKLVVDGEMQADVAVNSTIREGIFSFSDLDGDADILIFPDLNSANISYKLLAQLGDATPIGPILVPMDKAANIVQRTSTVTEIVNISTVTALMASIQKNK